MSSPDYTASELAERFALTVHGDGTVRVHGVATLAAVGQGQLAFLANPRYRKQLADSHASIVVLRADDAAAAPHTALIAKDPYTAFARISALFEVLPVREAGIHPSAVIHASARVSPGAHVAPFVTIGANSHVGDGCVIGPGCVIGEDCELDAGGVQWQRDGVFHVH